MSVAATLQRLILEHNIQNAVFFLLDTCSIYKEGETFLYTVLHCANVKYVSGWEIGRELEYMYIHVLQ